MVHHPPLPTTGNWQEEIDELPVGVQVQAVVADGVAAQH